MHCAILNFTVDTFQNGTVHFLYLEITDASIDVFRQTDKHRPIHRFSIIRKLKERQNLSKHRLTEQTGTDTSEDVSPKIWLRIPFLGKQGEFLVKRLIILQKRCHIFCLKKIKFRTYPEAI